MSTSASIELSEEEQELVILAVQQKLDEIRQEFIYAAMLLNDDPIPARLN